MTKSFVTDLSDFVGSDGLLVDGPAGRLAGFLSHVVEVGTASGCEGWFDSALPCRHRRRRRKRCEGFIQTCLIPDDAVQWQCPSCGENGVVTGWAKWVWDLSWAGKQASGRGIEVVIHETELTALRNADAVSTETPELVARATRRGSRSVIAGSADRLLELLDCVDVDTIKAPRRVRRILEAVRWRLAIAIPSHYLWQRLNKPEPLADHALLEREHAVAWLRMRIDDLMRMASLEWRMVRLFTFALKEVLANIMALARQEPQAALVLLEHYTSSPSAGLRIMSTTRPRSPRSGSTLPRRRFPLPACIHSIRATSSRRCSMSLPPTTRVVCSVRPRWLRRSGNGFAPRRRGWRRWPRGRARRCCWLWPLASIDQRWSTEVRPLTPGDPAWTRRLAARSSPSATAADSDCDRLCTMEERGGVCAGAASAFQGTTGERGAWWRRRIIRYVVDVRSIPYSRHQPDFCKESLERLLAESGLRYVFMGDLLGGRR